VEVDRGIDVGREGGGEGAVDPDPGAAWAGDVKSDGFGEGSDCEGGAEVV
jgi:hypothetical protein